MALVKIPNERLGHLKELARRRGLPMSETLSELIGAALAGAGVSEAIPGLGVQKVSTSAGDRVSITIDQTALGWLTQKSGHTLADVLEDLAQPAPKRRGIRARIGTDKIEIKRKEATGSADVKRVGGAVVIEIRIDDGLRGEEIEKRITPDVAREFASQIRAAASSCQ